MKRDLKADLEMCEKATPGPWRGVEKGNSVRSFSVETVAYIGEPARHICSGISPKTDDCQFIVESREALPYWIKRAQEAEDLLKSIFFSCGVCFSKTDCGECKETEKRIKRFLGIKPCDK